MLIVPLANRILNIKIAMKLYSSENNRMEQSQKVHSEKLDGFLKLYQTNFDDKSITQFKDGNPDYIQKLTKGKFN